jgi:hypothetical protein
MSADDMRKRFGENGRIVEAFGAEEAEAKVTGGLRECDVDVVEDLDVIAEEANGLEDDGFVAFVADGREGVLDGGADPWPAGDALALEGEEP